MKKETNGILLAILLAVSSIILFWFDTRSSTLPESSLFYILFCSFNFIYQKKHSPILVALYLSVLIVAAAFVKNTNGIENQEWFYRTSALIGVWTFTIYFRLQFYFTNQPSQNLEEYKIMWRKRFFTISWLAFVKLLAITVLIYTILGNHEVDELISREQKSLKTLQIEKRKDLNKVYTDILLLANFHDIKNYRDNLNSVAIDLSRASRMRPLYDQIRILDLNGKEVVRINGGKSSTIVTQDKLQDKRHKAYFTNSLTLTEKQVYISPIEFNKEFGKIEIPHKPVLRISKPIFNNDKIVGVLVINYLTQVEASSNPTNNQSRLGATLSILNKSGLLLYQSLSKDIKNRIGDYYSKTNPQLWKKLKNSKLQAIQEDGNYFLRERVAIKEIIDPSLQSKASSDPQKSDELILLKYVPQKIINAAFHKHFWLFLVILIVTIFLFITITRHLYLQMKREELSRIKFESVFNNTHAFIGIIATDGTLTEVNDTALKFVGLTRSDVVGKKVWDAPWWRLGEELIPKLKESVENAVNGSFIQFDVDVVGSEGQIITIDFTLRPVRDNEKKVIYLIPEGQDITDKNKLQKELLSTNENFKKIQKLAKVGVWRVDLKEMKAIWDEQVYAIHELPFGTEVTVEEGINFYHPDHRKNINDAVEGSIKHKTSWDIEALLVTATGAEIWVRAIGYPVFLNGELIELRGMFMDINSKVIRDIQIKSLNDSLEKKVEERTKELDSAVQQLDEANKELEAFSYSVSHDLKAPLRALQGFSKNLVSKYADKLDETGVRWLNFISENAQSMDDLIQDMLFFSQMNKKEITNQEINMQQLAENQIEKFKIIYPADTNIILHELPAAYGDKAMIETVWQNIIGNAFKYSRKKTVLILKLVHFRMKSSHITTLRTKELDSICVFKINCSEFSKGYITAMILKEVVLDLPTHIESFLNMAAAFARKALLTKVQLSHLNYL